MQLLIYCAACDRETVVRIPLDKGEPDKLIRPAIEAAGWVVQLNGPHFDIYCSNKCAS